MNIYLLRHGETDWNKEGRLQGHTDIPLNQNGRRQIKHIAEAIDHLGLGIERIIASPLSRACESAEIVAKQLAYEKENILVEPLLIERCFGAGEGKTITERAEKYPGDNYPQMESFHDLIARAHLAFEKIVDLYDDKQNVLLVAHGAILYAMLTAITNGQVEYGGIKVTFDQASLHRIQYLDGEIKLARYDEKNMIFMDVEFTG